MPLSPAAFRRGAFSVVRESGQRDREGQGDPWVISRRWHLLSQRDRGEEGDPWVNGHALALVKAEG